MHVEQVDLGRCIERDEADRRALHGGDQASGACRAARRTPPGRRRATPRPPAAPGCSRPRSVPRRWRGKSPPASARPAADTAAARSVGLARAIIARPPRWCRPWSPSARRPVAASSSRMRSDSVKFLALRAALRAAIRLSISAAGSAGAGACFACHAFSSSRRKPKNPSVPASALRPAAFFKPCISAIAFGVLRSSSKRFEHGGRGTRIGFGRRRVEEARQRLLGLLQALHRPVDRLPIVARQHRQPHHVARPIGQHVADDDEIAEALAHLLAFDLQEAVVHPEIRHHLAYETRSTIARSRSRGAGTPDRCRRRGCRRSRRDASTTSPSIRCASPAGPAS